METTSPRATAKKLAEGLHSKWLNEFSFEREIAMRKLMIPFLIWGGFVFGASPYGSIQVSYKSDFIERQRHDLYAVGRVLDYLLEQPPDKQRQEAISLLEQELSEAHEAMERLETSVPTLELAQATRVQINQARAAGLRAVWQVSVLGDASE